MKKALQHPKQGLNRMTMKRQLVAAWISFCFFSLSLPAASVNGRYVATAYSVTGITKSGEWTQRHIVASDPDVIPIGSRVKITKAGRYSGEYVVADTGAKIQGRRLDIYMPSEPECKKFGVKTVRIRVISRGDGTQKSAQEAAHVVKVDVAKDVAKGTVGNAATDVDWKTQGKPVEAAVKADAAKTPAAVPAVIAPK